MSPTTTAEAAFSTIEEALEDIAAGKMVVVVPLFIWVAARFRARTFPASYTDALYKASVAGIVEEAVTGVRVVKAFGQEAQEQEALGAESKVLFQSRIRSARITAVFSASLDAFPGLAQIGVLALGGWLVMQGNITLGVFLIWPQGLLGEGTGSGLTAARRLVRRVSRSRRQPTTTSS